jgi:hypothetical protein
MEVIHLKLFEIRTEVGCFYIHSDDPDEVSRLAHDYLKIWGLEGTAFMTDIVGAPQVMFDINFGKK